MGTVDYRAGGNRGVPVLSRQAAPETEQGCGPNPRGSALAAEAGPRHGFRGGLAWQLW